MKRKRLLAGVLLVAVLSGCDPYYNIHQHDAYKEKTFNPGKYKGVAVIFASSDKKNKLFLEAMGVELMKRGYDVIEREKIDQLIHEQFLAKGNLAGVSDREKAMRLGKLLNADLVFYGDALVNHTFYLYELSGWGAMNDANIPKARELQAKANTTGVVDGVNDGAFEIKGFYDVGVSAHAVDTATGEIVWVGYRLLASCVKVSGENPTALNNFGVVCDVCSGLIDDFMGKTTTNETEG